jgi:hypothetical protein
MSNALGVVLALAVFCQSAMLGAGVFDAIVHSPNWRRAESLLAYRKLFQSRHPGHFFPVLASVTTVLLVAALLLSVLSAASWAYAAVALASVAATMVFTLSYFIPRNRMLFFDPVEERPGPRSLALVRQWEGANVVRLLIQVPGVAASLIALAAIG